MVQITLATAGGIVGIVSLLGAAVSIKSLKDYCSTLKSVDGKVREAVDQEVAIALRRERKRLSRLERILAREDIPERTQLDYIIPAKEPQRRSPDLDLILTILERRGFEALPRYEPALREAASAAQVANFTANVVIVDLKTAGVDQDIQRSDDIIRLISNKTSPQEAVLFVYGSGYYKAPPELNGQGYYCVIANSALTVVSRLIEAAYLADALNAL